MSETNTNRLNSVLVHINELMDKLDVVVDQMHEVVDSAEAYKEEEHA